MKKLLAMLTTITSLSSITPIILANAPAEIPERFKSVASINTNQCGNSCKLSFVSLKNTKLIHHGDYWLDISESGFTWPSDIKLEYPNRFRLFGYKNWISAFNFYKDNGTLQSFNTPGSGIKTDIYTMLEIVNVKITIGLVDKLNDFKHYITSFSAEIPPFPSLDWVKKQSQFTLVDSTKKMTWTRSDLITVDEALNIEIANPNIDKVVFDNVLQPQTNKEWSINVKPEAAPRDHHLQVNFTLDGKPYTSEITVSMQAKIDAPKPIVKENLDKVIKFGDENNLGNILDNNDNTIISAITQKNSLQVDFSQIEFAKKDIHSVTLTAKPDSTSYQGSVEVTYNVVPTTIVDLQIDLHPTASEAIVVKDYVGQIDPSTITNSVQTFYYANSESTITIKKPTTSSVITGVVYGCDAQWNKTLQHSTIDATNGIKLDGSQLSTNNGKYVVELADNLGHINNIYLQIAPKQAITNYLDTDNGKQFAIWAQANGYDNIRGASDRQLNKLFTTSQTWKPQDNGSEKSNSFDPQIANSNPPNNNEKELTGWAIIGIVIGALSGLLLLGWLFKKFVVTPFILEPIRKKKVEAFQRQTEKDIAQMKAEEKEEQEKNK